MRPSCTRTPVDTWLADTPGRAGSGTLVDNLREGLHQLASLKQTVLPLELAMLLDAELAQARADRAAAGTTLPGPPGRLADYLASEQRLGRVRDDVDPTRTARVLLAVLFATAVGAGPDIDGCVEAVHHGLLP